MRAKARAARRAGLCAIVCVGETRAERDGGRALAVVGRSSTARCPTARRAENLVIAYEPVWAIGTGLTPTPADVAEMHGFIRQRLASRFGAAGEGIRILYGGSVKPSNAKELMSVADVDGALVGGASLKADEFLAIAARLSLRPCVQRARRRDAVGNWRPAALRHAIAGLRLRRIVGAARAPSRPGEIRISLVPNKNEIAALAASLRAVMCSDSHGAATRGGCHGRQKTPGEKTPIARRNFLLGAGTAVAAGTCAVGGGGGAESAPATAPAPATPEPLLTLDARPSTRSSSPRPTPSSRRRAFALGQRVRGRDLHRPPTCRRLRQRRTALSRRAVPKGKPELGYQLALTPREFFRAGIAAANEWTRKTYGKDFDRLSEQEREAALKTMEAGKAEFPGFTSTMFFNALLQITMEGFFADPMYGGNRDMAAWKMIGYPGLPATYREEIKKYFGKKYDKPPRSIADFS